MNMVSFIWASIEFICSFMMSKVGGAGERKWATRGFEGE